MKKLILFLFFIIIFVSCSRGPAVNEYFDFSQVGIIELANVADHAYAPRSGETVQSTITYNFLKNGFNVVESDLGYTEIHIGQKPRILELSCIITEFTDSEVIVVPYRIVDRGSTKTTISQSTDADISTEKAETSTSTSTTTDGGSVREGSRIDYTQARVGIILKMKEKDSGSLVWSNSYWYSGLELQRTTEICVRNSLSQLRKLFK